MSNSPIASVSNSVSERGAKDTSVAFASRRSETTTSGAMVHGAGEQIGFKAANDDNSIDGIVSRIRYSKKRRWPQLTALLASLIWIIFVLFGEVGMIGFTLPTLPSWVPSQEKLTTLLLSAVPCGIFFIIAAMINRTAEASDSTEALISALHLLTQLDDGNSGNLVSLSASIRQQAFGVGDGMERAVARAVELEGYVRKEINQLEKAYSEGERRTRKLLDELRNERAAIGSYGDAVAQEIEKVRRAVSSHVEAETSRLFQSTEDAERRYANMAADHAEALAAAFESQRIRLLVEFDNGLAGAVSGTSATLTQISQQLADQWKNEADRRLEASSQIVERLCLRLDALSDGELEIGVEKATVCLDKRITEAKQMFDGFCAALREQTQATQLTFAQHMKDNASNIVLSTSGMLSNELAGTANGITEQIASMLETRGALVVERIVKTNDESNLAVSRSLESGRTETAILMQAAKETLERSQQLIKVADKDRELCESEAWTDIRALVAEIAERIKSQHEIMESWLYPARAGMDAAAVERLNDIYRLLFDEQSGLHPKLQEAQTTSTGQLTALATDVNMGLNTILLDMHAMFKKMSEEISIVRSKPFPTQEDMRVLQKTPNLNEQSYQGAPVAHHIELPAIPQTEVKILSAVRNLNQVANRAREKDTMLSAKPTKSNEASNIGAFTSKSSSSVEQESVSANKKSTGWLLDLLARADKA